MIQSTSAAHAKKYFNEALEKSDYYVNAQELPGNIRGKLAARLGIEGVATKEFFQSLSENIHPLTGKKLTPRKSDRRTVGYDINFHCPKSVSILHVLSKDNHILDAFQDSVIEIMHDIEHDSKTRKRKKGQDEDISTGELVWADFIHQTARPIDGSEPDPHLHCHCFTFNATWDDDEQRYKAAQFRDIKRDMPYYQAKFQKVLSDRLMNLGYGIQKTETAFEVEGVPNEIIDCFSKRTNEIGMVAKESGITNPQELDKLGGRTRRRKQKGSSMDDLKKDWRHQIRALGLSQTQSKKLIRSTTKPPSVSTSPKKCIDHAIGHCFEHSSVVHDRRILAKAFTFGIGSMAISANNIIHSFEFRDDIIKANEGSKTLCTTLEIINEEKEMVGLVKSNTEDFQPFYDEQPPIALEGEQGSAIAGLMTRNNQVMIVEGRAGTGKTTLMKEAINLIEKSGKKVFVAAPTSEASRGVLRDEGFSEAETVAKLLSDPQSLEKLTGQVLWIDEAGLLGVKDMSALLKLAQRSSARVILAGDTRQHSAVARGDALRVLKDLAQVPAISLTTIRRQKHLGYRQAVLDLSKGNVADGFETLDQLGFIKTISKDRPADEIATAYAKKLRNGKTGLIVSPTHKQGLEVTTAVREILKKRKKIGKRDFIVRQLMSANMTDAEKNDPRSYKKGHVLQITQNKPGMTRGSCWVVDAVKNQSLIVTNVEGKKFEFAVEKEKDFEVYHEAEIPLSKGDAIRVTRNGFDTKKKRLNNGQSLEIVAIDKKGEIVARNPISKAEYRLPHNFGHIAHGYCLTSHASQGKTVDEVFIYQPSATFPATDLKQFYVSVSRGREKVHIYTDDKEALIDHASTMRDRQSGLELLNLMKDNQKMSSGIHANNLTSQSRPLYTL